MLEVICTSLADARAAEHGGADRIELVRDLERDGLTPALALVAAVRRAVRIPIRVMLRERNTFDTNPDELAALCATAAALQDLGVDGLVLGLTRAGVLDSAALHAISAAAPALRITFHRAIEHVHDPVTTLAMLAHFPQVDTVLHSGGPGTLETRITRLNALQRTTAGRMTILAGGGMTDAVIQAIGDATRIRAFHVGRSARTSAQVTNPIDAARVRALQQRINAMPSA
jgi:copper homeostasis protein